MKRITLEVKRGKTQEFLVTKKVFWANPYLDKLKTRVSTVQGSDVTVEQTIFYAFSGGQESDRGSFNNIPVLEANKTAQDIVYTLPAEHGLQVGDEVEITIDWNRRYRLMRLHFAAEIILESVYQMQPGIEKIGAHIGEDKSRVDFACAQNISAYFPALLQQLEQLVAQNVPVISEFSDVVKQQRYWEISGFAHVPCGGTHLKSTREIGQIQLRRKNIGRNKERIEISLLD
jgi:alanyl-tRNA synthetase